MGEFGSDMRLCALLTNAEPAVWMLLQENAEAPRQKCWTEAARVKREELPQSIDCNSFPGLKRTARPGGIETSAPVRGLRPIPVLRGRTLNTPNPRSSMRLPPASAFFMLSKTVSTASSALVLVMPVLATTSLMMSSLITEGSRVQGRDDASSY